MVFVLDKHKQPLMPCTEKRARLLLSRRKAVIHLRYPFTIRLKARVGGETQPLALKIDPGSKKTGLALVRVAGLLHYVLWLAELSHRGAQIRKALLTRKGYRRRRRSANLRYRAPRFDNRRTPAGWLPPSLRHRLETILSWLSRLCRLVPTLRIKAVGRGEYQRTRVTASGFPRGYLMRQKAVRGFRTGDMVRAEVSAGKKTGIYTGRVAVRATGSFNIQTATKVVQGISLRYCVLLSRADGYSYAQTRLLPALKDGVSAATEKG